MSQPDKLRGVRGLIAGVLLTGIAPFAQATAPATQQTARALTECLGHYTINLPGEFEYALMNDFSGGLGAWGSEISLDLTGHERLELLISPPADAGQLAATVKARNEKQQAIRDDLLRQADLFTPQESMREKLIAKATATPTFDSIPRRSAFAAKLSTDLITVYALVNSHILSADMKLQGTPEQTLDAFLSHYKPRALGEVPTGPGVCVPYGFFTGEKQPATVGLNIRLKDHPDIVIFLLATDAASDPPDDPHKLWDGLEPVATFFGSRRVTPVHAIKPLRAITIDGREGLGSFVRITRRTVADQRTAFNNAAENDEDWGYFAYVPGVSGGKPGDSFNLKFKVERFGRFTKHPMSEDEFRELVARIASSIKRRPGAWAQN